VCGGGGRVSLVVDSAGSKIEPLSWQQTEQLASSSYIVWCGHAVAYRSVFRLPSDPFPQFCTARSVCCNCARTAEAGRVDSEHDAGGIMLV
jgi:hypothetical protein